MIGCGLNVISKDGIIVGINPFKNNEINEGKNCKNCTEYIDNISTMENKTFDYDNVIDELKNKMESTDSEKVCGIRGLLFRWNSLLEQGSNLEKKNLDMKVRELVDNIRKNMEAIKRDIMNNQLLLLDSIISALLIA